MSAATELPLTVDRCVVRDTAEWAARGISVNAIAPGYIRTVNTTALQQDPTRSRRILERIPSGRWGDELDLGGAAVVLPSRALDDVHGHVLDVDGGWLGR